MTILQMSLLTIMMIDDLDADKNHEDVATADKNREDIATAGDNLEEGRQGTSIVSFAFLVENPSR